MNSSGKKHGGDFLKGRTYEEIHGSAKARELKKKRRQAINKHRVWEYQSGKVWNKGLRGLQVNSRKGQRLPKWWRLKLSLAKGGPSSRTRGYRWHEKSQKILKSQDYTCECCGKVANSVHHIIPYKLWRCNKTFNLMSLCRSCHYTLEWLYYHNGDCDVRRATRRLVEQDRNDLAVRFRKARKNFIKYKIKKHLAA